LEKENEKKRRIKTYFAFAAMGIGGIITGILLIPTGIFAIIIYTIWTIINRIVCWCDKGDKNNDL
jgi:hypothetical protein